MEFAAYQKQVVGFALPSAQSASYLVPGAIAEIAEVVDVFSKGHRDGYTPEVRREKLTKELGDCAWFSAAGVHYLADEDRLEQLHETDYTETDIVSGGVRQMMRDKVTPELAIVTPGLVLASSIPDFLELWARDQGKDDIDPGEYWNLFSSLYLATQIAAAFAGIPWEVVQQANIDKLSSRSQRGVLSGSGDDR